MMPHPPRSTRTATLVPYSTLFLSHRLDHRLDEAGDLRRGGIGNFGRALAQDRVAHTGDLEYRHASNMRSRSSPVKGPSTTGLVPPRGRSEEHTSELQSLMRISYAVFCLKKKNKARRKDNTTN